MGAESRRSDLKIWRDANSRDARTHLKMIGSGVGGIELVIDGFSKKGNGGTDGRMDGQTDPLIEMRGRI